MGSRRCATPTMTMSTHPTSAMCRCVPTPMTRRAPMYPHRRLPASSRPNRSVSRRNTSANVSAHHVTSRRAARARVAVRLPTKSRRPVATAAAPTSMTSMCAQAIPATNTTTPGA